MIVRLCLTVYLLLIAGKVAAQPFTADYRGQFSDDGRYYIAISMSDHANVYIFTITSPEEPRRWSLRKIHISSLGLNPPCCGNPLFSELSIVGVVQGGTRLVYTTRSAVARIYDIRNNRVIYTSGSDARSFSDSISINDRAGLMEIRREDNSVDDDEAYDLVSLKTGAIVMRNRCPSQWLGEYC